jgi:molybdopterin-guanine dinucleotide biosynthesis protein A
MGRDKTRVELSGRPMYLWVAEALEAADCEVVVAGRRRLGDLPGYPDGADGPAGPLAGLLSIAAMAQDRAVMLAATDHPLLRAETVAALLDLPGPVVVPIDDNIAQVTCAVYRPAEIGTGPINGAHSIQDLITRVAANKVGRAEWESWGEDGRSWFSVDTPTALGAAERWPER